MNYIARVSRKQAFSRQWFVCKYSSAFITKPPNSVKGKSCVLSICLNCSNKANADDRRGSDISKTKITFKIHSQI